MEIHKSGYDIIIIYCIFLFFLFFLLKYLFKNFYILIYIPFFILLFFIIWFFRNPLRITNVTNKDVVAPVDGKVILIKRTFVKEFLNKECIQISIFISLLNVHVCRYPISGKVIYTKYHPGKYLIAWNQKSSNLNERTTCIIQNKNNKILFRQIAGFIARRIIFSAKINSWVKAGNEYGFIKFGSRVDIFLPLNSIILVKLGESISNSGQKIIAKLK